MKRKKKEERGRERERERDYNNSRKEKHHIRSHKEKVEEIEKSPSWMSDGARGERK
jgi:hypothetical protein